MVELGSKKVVEVSQKLVMSIGKRVLVANELDTPIEVEPIEHLDGSKPRLLIRIKPNKLGPILKNLTSMEIST